MVERELWVLIDAEREFIATAVAEKSEKFLCPLVFRDEREAWEYVLKEMSEDIRDNYTPYKMDIAIEGVTFEKNMASELEPLRPFKLGSINLDI